MYGGGALNEYIKGIRRFSLASQVFAYRISIKLPMLSNLLNLLIF